MARLVICELGSSSKLAFIFGGGGLQTMRTELNCENFFLDLNVLIPGRQRSEVTVYFKYLIIPPSVTGCMLRGQHIIIEMDFDSTDIVGLSYEKVNNKHKNY